jgi:hypothetical protein
VSLKYISLTLNLNKKKNYIAINAMLAIFINLPQFQLFFIIFVYIGFVLINQKFKTVLQKNEGCQTVVRVSKIISGEIQSMEGLLEDLTRNGLIYFKYALITTTDVERSFPRYKNLLYEKRRSFDFENFKKSFVVQRNNVSNINI